MIKAEIIADSIGEHRVRITSFFLTYPRFIHSELMTHRVFSRNAASSRAIPLKKMIERIEAEPAMPVYWGAEQRGMQSGAELTDEQTERAKQTWIDASKDAIQWAQKLADTGLHKSICNRVLEPFAHMGTLVTSTDYINFFNLRAHPEAQPEFQELAYQMLDLYLANAPREMNEGDWHLPYADKFMPEGLTREQLLKIVTARAARTSYLTMNNEIAHEKDYDLHDSLAKNNHWSPFEHAARCASRACGDVRFGNFRGWVQYRKQFPKENMTILTARLRVN